MSQQDLKLNQSLCYRCIYWDLSMVLDKHGHEVPEHGCSNDDQALTPGDRVEECTGFEAP